VDPACNSFYTVELYDQFGNLLPTDTVDFSFVNETLTYKVIEPECGNACWGTLNVDYKLPPSIECPPDVTIPCAALDFLAIPNATAGCVDFSVSLISEVTTPLDCDPDYSSILMRTYEACDIFGNCSTCSQSVTLERINLDSIVFPEPFTSGNGTAISCSDPNIQFDANGFPLPFLPNPMTGSGSGVPVLLIPIPPSGTDIFIDGLFNTTGSGSGVAMLPLLPNNSANPVINGCNASVTFTDIELPSNGCVRKIARTFEVMEWWCGEEFSTGSIQLIEIIDDQAPVLTCPPEFTVSTDHNCASNVELLPIPVFDECGNDVTVRIQTSNGIIDGNGGIVDLNLGNNTVTYIATDACFNQSSCDVNVRVVDNTEPVPVCETTRVVSLSNSMNSIVLAEPFDNGSFDECEIDRFEVKRLNSYCVESDTIFNDYVTFCCSDVGQGDVMVVFRVTDKAGNFNECMVSVEVQDKSIPTITCPDDVTIDCRDTYDINNLSFFFGSPELSQNCGGRIAEEIVQDNTDQCGTGSIIRKFQILDAQGNAVRSCNQNITITNDTPITDIDIIWPLDYEVTDACNTDGILPEQLPAPFDRPTFLNNDQCALLGFDFEDRIFQGNNGLGSCTTIERIWTVINWCGDIDGDGNFDQFVIPQPQIITIVNNSAPVINETGPLTFTGINTDCDSGPISLTLTATDDCDDLDYFYEIKNSDGVIIDFGNMSSIFTTLPVGSYTVSWRVSDACGNTDLYDQPITVLNSKTPTPVCLNGLSASLILADLDEDGIFDDKMVEIWATDFDSGSSQSCGNELVFSFSPDTTDRSIIYDCDNVGFNTVNLYVTDVTSGLQDFCTTFIDIQDNTGGVICEPNEGMRVSVRGDVFTEELEPVHDVNVSLIEDVLEDLTDDIGEYAFDNMPIGSSYLLTPEKQFDYLNGVSTLDIIFIQKHILGSELLESPYKLIAADINNSGSITAIDLIELRKLILGIYDELPDNSSWRFINEEQSFIDPLNPWSTELQEEFFIDELTSDLDINFIGVKVGDVNGSVIANAQQTTTERRSNAALNFIIEEQLLTAGQTYNLKISSDNYTDIIGWQTTFSYDNNVAEVLDVRAVDIEFETETNVNLNVVDEGVFSISYNDNNTLTIDREAKLMEIEVIIHSDIYASELFSLTSELTQKQAYNKEGVLLELNLQTTSGNSITNIESVSPNPWQSSTTINFSVASEGNVAWEFYNVDGKLLYTESQYYNAGNHSFDIDRSDINSSGIIYAKLITENTIAEYKMIVL
jgi:hypothetical protein